SSSSSSTADFDHQESTSSQSGQFNWMRNASVDRNRPVQGPPSLGKSPTTWSPDSPASSTRQPRDEESFSSEIEHRLPSALVTVMGAPSSRADVPEAVPQVARSMVPFREPTEQTGIGAAAVEAQRSDPSPGAQARAICTIEAPRSEPRVIG